MITDNERRKVAQKLRDDAKGGVLPYSDFLGAVAYDIGVEKENAAVLNRLADLIDPDLQSTVILEKHTKKYIERSFDADWFQKNFGDGYGD